MTEQTFRIVVGCDDAGLQYKEALKADLEKDPRVSEVLDVGVNADESTPYPHVAVAAARKPPKRAIADGYQLLAELGAVDEQNELTPIGLELARMLARDWLDYRFDPASASASKVDAISAYETGAADAAGELATEEDMARAVCD